MALRSTFLGGSCLLFVGVSSALPACSGDSFVPSVDAPAAGAAGSNIAGSAGARSGSGGVGGIAAGGMTSAGFGGAAAGAGGGGSPTAGAAGAAGNTAGASGTAAAGGEGGAAGGTAGAAGVGGTAGAAGGAAGKGGTAGTAGASGSSTQVGGAAGNLAGAAGAAGAAASCVKPLNCKGEPGACHEWTCPGGTCVAMPVANGPLGLDPTAGDCKRPCCKDGTLDPTCPDLTDPPKATDICRINTCTQEGFGVPTSAMDGTRCAPPSWTSVGICLAGKCVCASKEDCVLPKTLSPICFEATCSVTQVCESRLLVEPDTNKEDCQKITCSETGEVITNHEMKDTSCKLNGLAGACDAQGLCVIPGD